MILQQSVRYVPFIKNKRRVVKSLTFRWNDERVIEKCNDVNGDTIHENSRSSDPTVRTWKFHSVVRW